MCWCVCVRVHHFRSEQVCGWVSVSVRTGLLDLVSFVPFFGIIPSNLSGQPYYYSWQFECFIMVAIVFPDFSFESCMPVRLNDIDGRLILSPLHFRFYDHWFFRLMLLQLRFSVFNHLSWSSLEDIFPLYSIVCFVLLHRIMHPKLHWLMSTDCVKHLFLVISSMHRR